MSAEELIEVFLNDDIYIIRIGMIIVSISVYYAQ